MIQLIGPGGAGKSTTGRVLASVMGCPFVDLDREFETRHGNIDQFIATRGYGAYATANCESYLDIETSNEGVLALSSGFMLYPAEVHRQYQNVRKSIVQSATTFLLLPSFKLESCTAEVVRRQLSRPFGRRTAEREEQVIRQRFDAYIALPVARVETMSAPDTVVEAIRAQLPLRDDCSAERYHPR